MNQIDIANARLVNQQIAGSTFSTIPGLVGWMGAIQAQEFAMLKWAVGARLPGSKLADFDAAYNAGEIIRTHLLRPTWHLVAAGDLHWILQLTAPRIRQWLDGRHREQGMDATTVSRANAILETAVGGGAHLTRDELVAPLAAAGIRLDENRAAHLIIGAELEGILCSGPIRDGKLTYTLLESRIPKPADVPKDEALARLASRYFTSHGPATLADFNWWSGLPAREAKMALESVKAYLLTETVAGQVYWFANPSSGLADAAPTAFLLPSYDEYIISYADRGAVLPYQNYKKAVSINGIFRPVIVVNSQVIGIWKRTIKNDRVLIETDLFEHVGGSILNLIEAAATPYGRFLERDVVISHTSRA